MYDDTIQLLLTNEVKGGKRIKKKTPAIFKKIKLDLQYIFKKS